MSPAGIGHRTQSTVASAPILDVALVPAWRVQEAEQVVITGATMFDPISIRSTSGRAGPQDSRTRRWGQAGARCGLSRSVSGGDRRAAPGEMPTARLKARLNAASDA